MGQVEAGSVYALRRDRSRAEGSNTANGLLPIDDFERMLDLLRLSRHRLTAFRLRVHGATPGLGALLVGRALGERGYAARLRGGDMVFFRVASCAVANEPGYDESAEHDLVESLSACLGDLCGDGPRVRVLLSVAHVWSDEICDARELVELLTRVVPKADIAAPVPILPAHGGGSAWSDTRPQQRAAAV